MTAYERGSLAVDRNANRIAQSANEIASAQRELARLELLLAAIGVAFTGVAAFFAYRATHWAKEAAAQTKRSADADNMALEETRRAAADAREDAADAATRFQKELKIAETNLKLARQANVETDRAWLKVSVTPISGLRIQDDTISIDALVVVENVGKGPAIGVNETGDLSFSVMELDRTIRESSRIRAFAGRFGDIMFPGEKRGSERTFEVARQELVDAITKDHASENPLGVFPNVVVGASYCLPGDTTTRVTYLYLMLYRAEGGGISFDEGQTEIALDDLRWRLDFAAGPVT